MVADSTVRPGERLGDFAIERPLGRGGFKTVYAARNLAPERNGWPEKVAVCVPHAQDEEARELLRNELRVVQTLNHPGIVQEFGMGEADGRLFAVIELVEGQPLNALLAECGLLRDLVPELKGSPRTVLWVSPVLQIPPELQKDVTVVDLPLPTEADYRQVLNRLIEQVRDTPTVTVSLDEDAIDAIVKACQGLTRSEAENALAKAIVGRQGLSGRDVRSILDEKEQIIRKSGILEYTAAVEDFAGIGGLGRLKAWLRQRNEGFSQKARDFGLPNPRGVMLVGVPGCGKSLSAKAVAAEWQKPLLKFDLGRIFAGLVGESEERMRKALSVAEGVAPCVLWIDELEKGLAGIGGSGDSGVATRVFGTLLTWMEEKTQPVFVVATANDIAQLPPELLRKGRLDEIFFVDLPTPRNRAEILMIHLSRRKRAPTDYDIAAVAHATDGFSGAELEEVVVNALYEAYSSPERELKTEHLLNAAREIIPLSRSRAREIEALRQWATSNCRPASEPETAEAAIEAEGVAGRRARLVDI